MARGAPISHAPPPRPACCATGSTPSRWPVRAVYAAYRKWLVGRVRLALCLAWYWHGAGDLDEASQAVQRARRLAGRRCAVPATLVADLALTAARIAQDRDDTAGCRVHLELAVAVLEAAGDDAGTIAGASGNRLLGWSLVGLGDQHRRAGEYAAAEEVLNRALRLVASAGPDDPVLHAAALTSQGITAKELGAFDAAARCYAQVSRIHREFGATATDAAALEHNLAGLEYARGRYAEAQEHARQALALRRQVPRVAQVDLAADAAVLASALAAGRRFDEARMLLHEALTAYQTARPPRRYEIAVLLHNLADIEHALGRLADAEDLYRQALSLKEELLGTDHPEVGLLANNLGNLLVERGREREASDYYRCASRMLEQAYGPDHPLVDRVRRNAVRSDPAPA